jgi:transcriptional regulator with XRE-family HTH domain
MSTKPRIKIPFGFGKRNPLKGNVHWKYGQKARIASIIGMSRQQLNSILRGKSRALEADAYRLSEASRIVGLKIPALDFICSKETTNPLFDNGQDFIAKFEQIEAINKEVRDSCEESIYTNIEESEDKAGDEDDGCEETA